MRTTSGVVLAALTLGLTWWGPLPFAVLVSAVALILLWEWSRLTTGEGFSLGLVVTWLVIVGGIAPAVVNRPLQAAASAVLAAGLAAGLARRRPLMSLAGALYAGLPAISLVWFRAAPMDGLNSLVFLLLIVWATDIGAFIAGRLIGGPRLWPRVSPNKTWAGLVGGVAAASAIAMGYVAYLGGHPGPGCAVLAAFLAVVSQAGDLFESSLKRAHGAKDSSSLIPGHGGFMDRVDGLVFAAVAAATYALLVDPAEPAAALLGLR